MSQAPPISVICSGNPYPKPPDQQDPKPPPELDPPPAYRVGKFPRLCWPLPVQRELDFGPMPRPVLRLL